MRPVCSRSDEWYLALFRSGLDSLERPVEPERKFEELKMEDATVVLVSISVDTKLESEFVGEASGVVIIAVIKSG